MNPILKVLWTLSVVASIAYIADKSKGAEQTVEQVCYAAEHPDPLAKQEGDPTLLTGLMVWANTTSQ
jgi:hypothetical protein